MSDGDVSEEENIETPQWNRYQAIIIDIFERNYQGGDEFDFSREEIADTARRLNIEPPKNVGDVIYSFRYRAPFVQAAVENALPIHHPPERRRRSGLRRVRRRHTGAKNRKD